MQTGVRKRLAGQKVAKRSCVLVKTLCMRVYMCVCVCRGLSSLLRTAEEKGEAAARADSPSVLEESLQSLCCLGVIKKNRTPACVALDLDWILMCCGKMPRNYSSRCLAHYTGASVRQAPGGIEANFLRRLPSPRRINPHTVMRCGGTLRQSARKTISTGALKLSNETTPR